VGTLERAPVHLILRGAGEQLASVPLVAGMRRRLPDSGGAEQGVRIELIVTAWDIRAGSLRGQGDFGSRVELAWRRADRASDEFAAPVPGERVLARLPQDAQLQSRGAGL